MLLPLLYAAALRVSEVCDLCWRNVQEREDVSRVTAYGHDGKTRHLLLPLTAWLDVARLRAGAVRRGGIRPCFNAAS